MQAANTKPGEYLSCTSLLLSLPPPPSAPYTGPPPFFPPTTSMTLTAWIVYSKLHLHEPILSLACQPSFHTSESTPLFGSSSSFRCRTCWKQAVSTRPSLLPHVCIQVLRRVDSGFIATQSLLSRLLKQTLKVRCSLLSCRESPESHLGSPLIPWPVFLHNDHPLLPFTPHSFSPYSPDNLGPLRGTSKIQNPSTSSFSATPTISNRNPLIIHIYLVVFPPRIPTLVRLTADPVVYCRPSLRRFQPCCTLLLYSFKAKLTSSLP